jgi:hypothetical protein
MNGRGITLRQIESNYREQDQAGGSQSNKETPFPPEQPRDFD